MTDHLALLGRAHTEFARRLAHVGPGDWWLPTPCTDWNVRELVNHLVGGGVRYRMLLDGAGETEVAVTRGLDHLGDDPVEAFERTAEDVAVAFAQPGAMERIVHHRAGDCPGEELWALRILECTLHAWDLARALGIDDRLDRALLETIDSRMQPVIDRLRALDTLAPAGVPPTGASLQDRVLLSSGRTP